MSGPAGQYSYNPANQRVWRYTSSNGYDEFALYGLDGKRLATYKINFTMPAGETPAYATVTTVDTDVYFAGRLIGQGGPTFAATPTDNIASTRSGPSTANGLIVPSSFFPWGEEQTSTTNDRVKFATYRRDSESNLDYAWNRYYNNATARFMSPDPSSGSTSPASPESWNKYSYVLNDPIRNNDPSGLYCMGPGIGFDPFDPCQGDGDGCSATLWGNDFVPLAPGGASLFCQALPVLPVVAVCPAGWLRNAKGGCVPPPCPPKYQAWIDAHGTDAVAAGLPEANALALTSIETDWGKGNFAKNGNAFFNLETFWKPGTPMPGNKFADQLGWMPASEMIRSGTLEGYYALVATYSSPLNSFLSAAARFSNLTATNPTTFDENAAADGINAAKSPAFFTREKIFADCLTGK